MTEAKDLFGRKAWCDNCNALESATKQEDGNVTCDECGEVVNND